MNRWCARCQHPVGRVHWHKGQDIVMFMDQPWQLYPPGDARIWKWMMERVVN